MSYLDTNFSMENILNSMNELVAQPVLVNNNNMYVNNEHHNFDLSKYIDDEHNIHHGSGKSKKIIKSKKVKQIDLFKKDDLIKIAKKNDISLKTRDGKLKTKEQLFNSLKRKELIKIKK